MKQFSNKIMVCSAYHVPEKIEIPYTGLTELHSNIDLKPDCKMKNSDAGSFYNFSLRSTHNELSDSQAAVLNPDNILVLFLFDTEGNYYKVGSAQLPVKVVNNAPQFDNELKFTAQLLKKPW